MAREKGILRTLLFVAVLICLGSCAGPQAADSQTSLGRSVTRHHIYVSLDEMLGDSKVLVTGTVESVSAAKLETLDVRLITLKVSEQLFPSGLGMRPVDAQAEGADPAPLGKVGNTVVVQQIPGLGSDFEIGASYMLFLVPTGIEGPFAKNFYVTGAGAGTYQLVGDSFRRLTKDGDNIPESLTVDSLR